MSLKFHSSDPSASSVAPDSLPRGAEAPVMAETKECSSHSTARQVGNGFSEPQDDDAIGDRRTSPRS